MGFSTRMIANSDLPLTTNYNFIEAVQQGSLSGLSELNLHAVDDTQYLIGVYVAVQCSSFLWQFKDHPVDWIKSMRYPITIGAGGLLYWFFKDRQMFYTCVMSTNALCTVGVKVYGRTTYFRRSQGMMTYND